MICIYLKYVKENVYSEIKKILIVHIRNLHSYIYENFLAISRNFFLFPFFFFFFFFQNNEEGKKSFAWTFEVRLDLTSF